MTPSRSRLWWAVSIGSQVGAAALVGVFGSRGPVPLHFDWNGRPNAWGSRDEVALIILALAAATAALAMALPALSRSRGRGRSFHAARWLLQTVFPLVSAFLAAMALSVAWTSPTAQFAFLSALSLVLGLWLGKVEPNPVVGIRTYWTSRSRLAWDKSNRLFGRIAFWSGLIGLLATPLAPQPPGLRLIIAMIVGAAALAVFESWRVARRPRPAIARLIRLRCTSDSVMMYA